MPRQTEEIGKQVCRANLNLKSSMHRLVYTSQPWNGLGVAIRWASALLEVFQTVTDCQFPALQGWPYCFNWDTRQLRDWSYVILTVFVQKNHGNLWISIQPGKITSGCKEENCCGSNPKWSSALLVFLANIDLAFDREYPTTASRHPHHKSPGVFEVPAREAVMVVVSTLWNENVPTKIQ